MLTADLDNDKDFEVNNLFINLDFTQQEETFEYKWPILEHPSNYQMLVTKFFSKTSLPYIKMEQRESDNEILMRGENHYFDYHVFLYYVTKYENGKYEGKYLTSTLYNMCSCSEDHKSLYKLTIKEQKDDEEKDNDEDEEDIYEYNTYYTHKTYEANKIYSPIQFINMINNSLFDIIQKFIDAKDKDPTYYTKEKMEDIEADSMHYFIENGKLKLRMSEKWLKLIQNNDVIYDDKTEINHLGMTRIAFSPNLFRYLRSIMLVWDENSFKISISSQAWNSAKIELKDRDYTIENDEGEEETITEKIPFRIFEGEEINMMKWCDYIGIAITSPDFPVKQQYYPHFNYSDDDRITENRKRYIDERDIIEKIPGPIFDDQLINDQIKETRGERIIFLKYFGKDEDLNYINYENNDINSSQMMDLINQMPLKKFTMRIYLIDRYRNFEPIEILEKYYDDVVKMQILFRRIKGTEKENRTIFEANHERERVNIDLIENNEEDNEMDENEILKRKLAKVDDNELLKKKLELIDLDEYEEEPPEKKMYMPDNLNSDSENENELY